MEERPPDDRPSGAGPRIGVWGPFDLEGLGEALYPRVVRSELARRLPAAPVRGYAPRGHLRPTRFDGGEPAEPLGGFVDERRRALAAELDCVVVGGLDLSELGGHGALAERYGAQAQEVRAEGSLRYLVEGLGPELERRCPILWHAVEVSASIAPEDAVVVRDATRGRPLLIARDEGSRDRLRSAGIGPGIEVGPDPAVLASRVFAPALLRRRLAWLRFMGWYPVEGEAVVLQGAAGDVGSAARIATAAARVVEDRPGSSLVLLPTGPGDGDFAEAVAQEVPEAVRLPDEIGVEDIVAALAACSVFVGTSYHAHLVAMAYRRPQIVLPVSERPALAELADLLGQRFLDVEAGLVKTVQRAEEAAASPAGPRARLRAAADGHLDRIAAIALESDGRRPARGPGRVARPVDPSAARARQVQARRLALARSSLADRDAERRRALIAPVLHAEWRVRKALRLPYRVLRGWVRR